MIPWCGVRQENKETESRGRVVTDTAFSGERRGERKKLLACQIPRQCPLVLLINVGSKNGKSVGKWRR
jgi:hypothetical protein